MPSLSCNSTPTSFIHLKFGDGDGPNLCKVKKQISVWVDTRVVNRFCKRSLNDRFLFRFQKRSFRFRKKRPTRFEILENDQRSFLKTIIFIKTICNRFLYDCFQNTIDLKTIVSFSIFRRRFHNETIVFLKNENVNIPIDTRQFL